MSAGVGMVMGFLFMSRMLMFDIFVMNVSRMCRGMRLPFLFVRMLVFMFKRVDVGVHMLVGMAVNDISMAVGMLVKVLVLAFMLMGVGMFPFHGS